MIGLTATGRLGVDSVERDMTVVSQKLPIRTKGELKFGQSALPTPHAGFRYPHMSPAPGAFGGGFEESMTSSAEM